jgi:MFS family permease
MVLFLLSPIKPPAGRPDSAAPALPLKSLLIQPVFIAVALAMLCAGASEHGMSQWASMFAEAGLNVSKTAGDLAGPLLFAVLMGLSRILYPAISRRVSLEKYMLASGIFCMFGYLLAGLAPVPALAFTGCGICGFSAGIFWPGTISLASKRFPEAGTAMFAALSLAGNIGGASGPAVVGALLERFDSFGTALAAVSLFPFILAAGVAYYMREAKRRQSS